ncbi:glycosyltransferase, partial [Paracoccus sp. MC1862]|uniref:glycosyltransferase n=2 Tax=Paracoccus sp. MC1862 TaxID=2760307 RepID=UPI001C723212
RPPWGLGRGLGSNGSSAAHRSSDTRGLLMSPNAREAVLLGALNDCEEVPGFLKRPKIRVVRSQEAEGDLRDNGKFYDLPRDLDAYLFTFDDDLIYPTDYVSRMVEHIEMLERRCVVGVHAVIFPPGEFSRLKQRTVYHFAKHHKGHFVDLLGTGTAAWHGSTFAVSLDDFQTKGVCDLWFAVAAARQEVPLFSVPRGRRWLVEIETTSPTLYQEARQHPTSYFDVYKRSVAPALVNGQVRKRAEEEFARQFGKEALAAAGIELLTLDPRAEDIAPMEQTTS